MVGGNERTVDTPGSGVRLRVIKAGKMEGVSMTLATSEGASQINKIEATEFFLSKFYCLRRYYTGI